MGAERADPMAECSADCCCYSSMGSSSSKPGSLVGTAGIASSPAVDVSAPVPAMPRPVCLPPQRGNLSPGPHTFLSYTHPHKNSLCFRRDPMLCVSRQVQAREDASNPTMPGRFVPPAYPGRRSFTRDTDNRQHGSTPDNAESSPCVCRRYISEASCAQPRMLRPARHVDDDACRCYQAFGL